MVPAAVFTFEEGEREPKQVSDCFSKWPLACVSDEIADRGEYRAAYYFGILRLSLGGRE
jgi:hypothetical protein